MPTVTIDLVEYDKLRDDLKSKAKIIEQMADSDNCLIIPRYVWKSHSGGDELLDIHSTKDVLEHLDAALVKEVTSLATQLEQATVKTREQEAKRLRYVNRDDPTYTVPNEVHDKPKRWWQK